MRHTEDLNPSVQTGKRPGAGPDMEAMPADYVLESLGTRRPMEESTAAVDGVGSGERLTMMAADATEMPGATTGAAESSKVGAGAANIMPESRARRPVVPEE